MYLFLYFVPAAHPNEGTRSLSSDSGLSSASQWTGGQVSGLHISYSSEDQTQVHKPIPGPGMEEEPPFPGITRRDRLPANPSQPPFSNSSHLNGETMFIERETDIIDDDDIPTPINVIAAISQSKDTRETFGLSSLRGEQNSVLSDVGQGGAGINTSNTHTSVSTGYQTHVWVKQQQSVSGGSYTHTPSDRLEQRDVTHRDANKRSFPDNGFPEGDKDDEFATLALDIDHSIEQLNQLILDLDPEFEPIPTKARSDMTRSASLHSNGKMHSGGWSKAQQSGKTNVPTMHKLHHDTWQ